MTIGEAGARPAGTTAAAVRIRAIEPRDRPRLEAGLRALGPESLHRRFGRVTVDSEQALRWLDELDGSFRFAVGACHVGTGEPLGVARYVRAPGTRAVAEVAVTVVDAWQGRRVGTLLAARLAEHARACGIDELIAMIAAGNVPAMRLMRRLGARPAPATLGVVEMRAPLGR